MPANEIIQSDRRDFLKTSIKGVFLTTLLQIGLPFPAFANAPKEVLLTHDAAAKTLTVQITHSSSSPTWHYIAKVEIKKNEKSISTVEYKSQPDQPTFSYVYPIEASTGDVLEVKVICSILGSKTEKLTVK